MYYSKGEMAEQRLSIVIALNKDPKNYEMQRPTHNQPDRKYNKNSSENNRKRIERNIEDKLGGDQLGFRKGKGTRDIKGMLRIISERTLEIDEKLCACFVGWQKAFGV